jgi:hypothetical protein
MDINYTEEKQARLRREGMVDGLVDCLALLVQDSLHRAIQARVAETANPDDVREGAVAREGAFVREGAHDSYLACRHWVAQGLDGDALAARIVQRIFTIWPRAAADYQLRYDEFLEKELENPRATYYLSSREWMAAVEALREEVMRARDLNQAPTPKLLRRCLMLLLTRTPHPITNANLPAVPPPEAATHPHLIK